jgi:bacillithiol biosynthesis deacetylase BshB1
MLDVLVFAAHPDDAEMTAGGTLFKLKASNYKIGIVDFTKAELSSRGTIKSRQKEVEQASKLLNLDYRNNLDLGDGMFENSHKNRILIMNEIRKTKPKIIMAPFFKDRHPDHERCSVMVKEANFYAGLVKYETDFPHYRAKRIYYYMANNEFDPSLIINISNHFEDKMKLFKAYGSQFHKKDNTNDVKTHISRPEYLEFVRARARFYGEKAGFLYGEPYFIDEMVGQEKFIELD